MDIIKEQIEKVGGSISLSSTKHQGSQVQLRLPVIVSLLTAIVAEVGGTCLLVAQEHVRELLRLSHFVPIQVDSTQEQGSVTLAKLHHQVLPLFWLRKHLQWDQADVPTNSNPYVLLVEYRGRECGIVVDQIRSTESIVLQPLPPLLMHIAFFDGMTILENARVAYSLHVPYVLQTYGVEINTRYKKEANKGLKITFADDADRLWVQLLDKHHALLPLPSVVRVEKIPLAKLYYHEKNIYLLDEQEMLPVLAWPASHPEPLPKEAQQQATGIFVYLQLDGQSYVLWVEKVFDVVHVGERATQDQSLLPIEGAVAICLDNKQLLTYRQPARTMEPT